MFSIFNFGYLTTKSKMKQLISNQRKTLLFSLFLLFNISCTSVRLISEYDEITDKAVTALQEKVSTFFVKIESEVGTEDAKYINYKKFYQEAKVDLSTLQIRADAIDKNKIVQDQIAELTNMITNLEKLHKIGFTTFEQIKPLKQSFNSAFTAIIRLQLALKRGEKNK